MKNVCKYNERDQTFGIPGLALKMGHNLGQCATVLKEKSIRLNDKIRRQEIKQFEELLDTEWISEISSHALETLSEKKYNKIEELPLVRDVKKMSDYIFTQLKIRLDDLNKKISSAYGDIAKFTLAFIILLNRKRSGEAQRMTLDNYKKSSKIKSNEDITKSMTVVEKSMLTRIEI